MTTNLYFSQKVRSEQGLYEDIIIEALKMYGQDVYYIPRDIVNENTIFGEDVPSRFNSSHKIEMYIENVEGFDGEGDLFTKFGVEIRDQATFVVARRRWTDAVKRIDSEITSVRPLEGDLIYLPLSNSMFQIMHVEHEQPFYQLSNLPTYKLRCELFEYNDEDLDTGVSTIDDIQKDFAYRYILTFTQTQASISYNIENNTLSNLTITNPGFGYPSVPQVLISNIPQQSETFKFGSSSLNPSTEDAYTLNDKTGNYSSTNYRGKIEFFVYLESLPEEGRYYRLIKTGAFTSDEGTIYTRTFGVDSLGRLVAIRHQVGAILQVAESIPDANRLITGQWHHVSITYRGLEAGEEVRTLQLYIDGQVVYRLNSDRIGGIFGNNGYDIGGEEVVNDVDFELLDGYIDDFVAINEQPDYTDTITVPTTAQSARVNQVAYEDFDFEDITASVTISSGEVTDITINNNHNYFKINPTIVIETPATPVYTPETRASQTLSSGVVISGEVAKWDATNLTLWLNNVGSDDGLYHEFVTTQNVVDATSGDALLPSTVTEENVISENEQNDTFESFADNIIDFTESNPFGDPDES